MSEKFNNWQEVIVDFFENQVDCALNKAKKFIKEKEDKIITEKDSKKLERLKQSKEKKQEELIKLKKDAPFTEIRVWIEKNHNKQITEGMRIIKATHVLKFTHSSSDSGGLLLTEKANDLLLSTSSLKKKLTVDLAHNNGALITISRFLGLEFSGKPIIDLILDNKFSFLKPFCKDEKQLVKWSEGFANLVEQREMKTADKAKQLYFPVEKNTTYKYHLITPLFASSLYNEIDSVITNIKYGEEQKHIRECRKNKEDNSSQYHPSLYVDFLDLSVQNFGGEHPKNISMLNANRRGKCYLFSTQPPTWQSQLKPPIYKKSMFDAYYSSQNSKETINYLSDFLKRFNNLDLSIRDPKRKKHLDRWVNDLIDDWLYYVGCIQTLPAGWSEESKLKKAHRYLLDPYNADKTFQTELKVNNWQKEVCNDFSRWLNQRLRANNKKFTPQLEHSKMWRKLVTKPLREYSENIAFNVLPKEKAKS